ncbi:tail completion protein R (GpR) [Crenobacter luteus]|uniref:phage tail protein n=1 Tax=Crenobacter luteus TaxID=1452487 RepID=UPI001044E952|nr:phage tail protein [Crenobacter luteus]TCP13767.1 tail completion protein R (GpR) [Crenobacter luteus]
MNKPARLRAALEAALPYLVQDPDRLVMFIEGGRISTGMGKPSFEYKYTLTIGLLDFNLHPDNVMIPVLQWIRANEPMLLQNADSAREAITFDAEFFNHNSYDLKLQLKLSERVHVTGDGAGLTATHLGEPELGETFYLERLRVYANQDLVYDSEDV